MFFLIPFLFFIVISAMVLGMRTAVEGLANLSGKGWVQRFLSRPIHPLYGLAAGIISTVIVQSSSAVTMIAVGLVSSGILPLRGAVPFVFGANIGTTLTVQMLAHAPETLGWYLAFAGWFLWFALPLQASLGKVLAGFGLIFVGLNLLDLMLPPLAERMWFVRLIELMSADPWSAFFSGVLLTTLLMSSTVTIGIIQRLADRGLISVVEALPMLYGDNVGTTTDTLMVSIGAKTAGRQLALIHLLFNLVGSAFFWLLTPLFADLLQWLSQDPARQLAHAHFLFNLISAFVQLPLIDGYLGLTRRIVRPGAGA